MKIQEAIRMMGVTPKTKGDFQFYYSFGDRMIVRFSLKTFDFDINHQIAINIYDENIKTRFYSLKKKFKQKKNAIESKYCFFSDTANIFLSAAKFLDGES